MDMVNHKQFGMGEVVNREVVGDYTYITARFDTGREMRFCLPLSFETGAVEALGSLKDEVEQAIAQRNARPAAAAPTPAPGAPVKKSAAKTMPAGPIPTAFEQYLIDKGYAVETASGNLSTVYSYLNAVDSIRSDEGLSWDTLKSDISTIVPRYDVGGAKQLVGAKSNRTYICALKQFAEFVGKT